MDKKPHIGFICHEYPPCNHGGIGSFTKDLAEGLVQAGFKVSVIGMYLPHILDLNKITIEKISGVKIYRLPFENRMNQKHLNALYQRLKLLRFVLSTIKETGIDIIESPENQGWLPFGLLGKVPLITRFHGGEAYLGKTLNRPYSRFTSLMEKSQLLFSDQLVSVSSFVGKMTLDVLKTERNFITIYNSVKITKSIYHKNLTKVDVEPYLIVFSGSIIRNKGVEELILSMNIILKKFPEAKLILAGKNNRWMNDKKYDEYLMSLLDDRKYEKSINFLGAIDRERELFPLLSMAQVCCFPSYVESFSYAPLEAMALRKPVVFTKSSSGPEAIEDGVSGLLCDPKDPKDIAEKIMFLFENPDKAEELAREGQKRVQTIFSYEKWLKKNIDLYKKVLDEN
ncbi:glycosyltransferase family 4 protein [Nitratifractor salsuginis]|uniref:Glycosyl transferase group 1 n=1 Tax=Nitratifractor salsuginis (strain DSM 16511 / JCM 12458 / E9I37-1) TaxID=749222 RepID=E6X1A7_NITSE|nr:glycosyltransferase family 4 protein [Nitratifractor salsuginis]ADV46969.1 glycosyl transferase group 1 [Nitratifractor salsuginis DSM 16511]